LQVGGRNKRPREGGGDGAAAGAGSRATGSGEQGSGAKRQQAAAQPAGATAGRKGVTKGKPQRAVMLDWKTKDKGKEKGDGKPGTK